MPLIETHAHTSIVSPCGRLSPRDLVDGYVAAGYHGLVVTDHLVHSLPLFRFRRRWRDRVRAYFSGFRAVRDAAAGTVLRIYPGFELTFAEMPGYDFLVYGIDEERLSDMPDVCRMQPREFRRRTVDLGALVYQAHPFRGVGPAPVELLDGVEVYNGNPRHDSRDASAEAFAARHGLLRSSGSDAHQACDIGRGGLIVPELPETIDELVGLLRKAPSEIVLFVPEAAAG